MANATVRFYSDALGKWMRYNVLLPDEGEGPFPVLMQLHGLSDDEDSWIERSNLARYVADLRLVVVLPSGGTSAYLNWKGSGRLHRQRYEDYLMTDLPNHLRRQFQVADDPWAIGGLSMGGYGALRLGMKHPERFCSVWGHSSALHIAEMADADLVEDIGDADPYRHAEALAKRGSHPVISFDCGVEDELIDHNRRFHEHLQTLNLEHRYAEHPGGHTWAYWPQTLPLVWWTASEIASRAA